MTSNTLMNPSLRELQIILANRVRLLSAQLDNTTTAEQAERILGEIQEFNHRATLVGSLLFREQSENLDNKVAAIRRAKSKVDEAIKNLEDMHHMLQVSSHFLALVDEMIDFAKMV